MRKTPLLLSAAAAGFLLGASVEVIAQIPVQPSPPVHPFPPALPGLSAPAAPAPVQVPNAPAPKMQFQTNIFDFGRVSAGTVVRADFYYTNAGVGPLEVTEVRPTCGCTTAGAWERHLEPGQSGKIPLQVNTLNFSGPVVKMITVVCNDPAVPMTMLQIKGTIWKPIDVTPNFVVFSLAANAETNDAKSIKIVNNTDDPMVLTDPQSGNAAFRVEIRTNTPGKDYDLVVSTVPPLNPGTIQGMVTVKTSSTNMPVVSITALAMIQQPVVVLPAQLFLQPGPLPTQVQMPLSIRNNGASAIRVYAPKFDVTNVTAQIQEAQPGHQFNVTLAFPAGFELAAGQTAHLTLETSYPQMPVITVPIIQLQRPNPVLTPPPPPPPQVPILRPVPTSTALPLRPPRPPLPPQPDALSAPPPFPVTPNTQ
jgi:hypothetical protein